MTGRVKESRDDKCLSADIVLDLRSKEVNRPEGKRFAKRYLRRRARRTGRKVFDQE